MEGVAAEILIRTIVLGRFRQTAVASLDWAQNPRPALDVKEGQATGA